MRWWLQSRALLDLFKTPLINHPVIYAPAASTAPKQAPYPVSLAPLLHLSPKKDKSNAKDVAVEVKLPVPLVWELPLRTSWIAVLVSVVLGRLA